MSNHRSLIAATAALAISLTACSSGGDEAGPSGDWTFKTSVGSTITLDHQPTKVITDTYSAAALWEYGIRPVGIFGFGADTGSAGNADLSTMQNVGTDSEFSIEKAAALAPDIIVGYSGSDAPNSWLWWDEAVSKKAADGVAPFLGIDFGTGVKETIQNYENLAEALGADIDAPAVKQARDDFNTAIERVRTTVAAKPGVKVLPLNVDGDDLYTGARGLAIIDLLSSAGVTIVGSAPADEYWGELSPENLPTINADLVMNFPNTQDRLQGLQVYTNLAAVKANQTMEWEDKRPNTWANYAAWLNDFADHYEKAQIVS